MQQAVTPPEETNKLLGLEALRFLTAFAILVFHYRHFAFVADQPVGLEPERLPLYGTFRWLHDSGAFGVWVFWCISGFIFFWKYRDPIAERAVGGWKFFTLRFSRLYPLHLVTLLSVALLQTAYFDLRGSFFVYQANDLQHFLTQLFMASEWGITKGESFDGPIWSVSVEVLVYLLFFLMLRATRLWLLNVVIVAACLAAAHLSVGELFVKVTNCLALFYAGGLAAAVRRAADTSRLRTAIEACGWLAAVVVMPLVIYVLRDQLDRFDLPLFVGFTPILLFCLSRKINLPRPMQAVIVSAGNLTYSSYLLHFPLQIAIVLCFALSGRPVPVYSGALFAVYLLTTLLLSYFTFRYFEAPAQRFIREAFRRTPDAAFRQASSA
ncbi:acyltransferase [Bradyrhizobium sp.]|uniref:acyltransferase family protein n=1 Tax=Bradyrhizobium sp. TaxID=376 RepID=UPI00261DE78C|nr:acyltransferase [Bradyrhizobium sp.]